MTAFKFLVIDDQSAEFACALRYAGLRAKAIGGAVVVLTIIHTSRFSHWVSISEDLRAQALEEARATAEGHLALLREACGAAAELVLAESDARAAIRSVLENDPAIRAVVLATSAGRGGPGPLISSLARQAPMAGRPVAVVVIPGDLTPEGVAELAAPGGL